MQIVKVASRPTKMYIVLSNGVLFLLQVWYYVQENGYNYSLKLRIDSTSIFSTSGLNLEEIQVHHSKEREILV
jgi:hypothetical protein